MSYGISATHPSLLRIPVLAPLHPLVSLFWLLRPSVRPSCRAMITSLHDIAGLNAPPPPPPPPSRAGVILRLLSRYSPVPAGRPVSPGIDLQWRGRFFRPGCRESVRVFC